MKQLALLAALFLAGCPSPPNPKPQPPPSADAAPPPPPPKPVPHADAAPPPLPPSDRFGLACANLGRLGCADYDPKTCSPSLRNALEQHLSPTLTDKAVDCFGVAPTKAAVRKCSSFEKCP